MHIPDGYLSPKTCAFFFIAMVPIWYLASKKAEKTLKLKQLPLLALGAAFTFVIMMFNIPIPGGSSGHMVGSVVVSAVLGPWAAIVALSLTLTLQAFLFGDGGITALGANSFNMALLMCFPGYYVYRALSAGSPGGLRVIVASGVAGYIALNLAALGVALELGIQPLIAAGIDGTPMYAPYPLSVTVPAMMIPHLLFLGPVEAVGTALVVSYIHRTNAGLFYGGEGRMRPLWIAFMIIVCLVPIGLVATGTPWGEWSMEEVKDILGYLPSGMAQSGPGWRGLLPDYSIPGVEGRLGGVLAYIFSALAGSVVVVFLIYLWGRLWRRR